LGEAHLPQILKLMRYGRAWLWIRMRRYSAPQREQGIFFADQSSADCITNMSGFDFRQAQVSRSEGVPRFRPRPPTPTVRTPPTRRLC
jgi:hypothetical protein